MPFRQALGPGCAAAFITLSFRLTILAEGCFTCLANALAFPISSSCRCIPSSGQAMATNSSTVLAVGSFRGAFTAPARWAFAAAVNVVATWFYYLITHDVRFFLPNRWFSHIETCLRFKRMCAMSGGVSCIFTTMYYHYLPPTTDKH